MFSTFTNFLLDEQGTAVPEYAIVMTVFAISLIGIFQLFLTESASQLTGTQTSLQSTALVAPTPLTGS